MEDDLAIGEALCELLQEEGFEVGWAANGVEALERLRGGRAPGVILLDLMMPVMDGWQFRLAQQREPDLASIPVIVLSADHALGQKVRGLAAAGWLAKPFEFSELLRTIKRVCDRPGLDGRAAHQAM